MPSPRSLDGPQRQSPIRPLVVLAVNNEETRAAYAYVLAATGFDVTTAGEAATWQSRPPESRPSIIVADVSGEPCDSWTPVQAFKRDPRTCDVPIVVVAAEVGAAMRERARREGCAAVCLRTCPAHLLASGLRAVLERVHVPTAPS